MKFFLEANQLTIRLEGVERVWALKRRLQVPHYAIADVDYLSELPSVKDYRDYIRLPGTSIPWYFLAGSYRDGKKREFWYVKLRQAGVLVISLKRNTLNYDKLRISCPAEIAQDIADWWRQHK
jgi:hypothetical protein